MNVRLKGRLDALEQQAEQKHRLPMRVHILAEDEPEPPEEAGVEAFNIRLVAPTPADLAEERGR